jgi:calcineurin-like phosphoesterase family protein
MRLDINLTQENNKQNVYFTSDFHLFHKNVIRFDNRPFDNVDKMHIAIEEGWNEVVQPQDIVIYLGDLSFARREEKQTVEDILNRLNGTIHFVLGNHDKYFDIKQMPRFKTVQDYLEVRIKHFDDKTGKVVETLFCCMHYPIYSWNKSHHGSFMIHGHCHGNLHHGEDASFYDNRKVIDVGCMLHDYKPISYLDIMERLKHVQLPKLNRNV